MEATAARRHALVVLLTATAGATDAVGFLALGGAFTSVMTGNLVLFGISVAHADGELARHTLAAIVCFIAGCAIGARLAGTPEPNQPVWPHRVTFALGVEAAIFAGYAIGWWTSGSEPRGAVQLLLLSATAVGLGIQSAAVQRFGVSGLSTTYMTGTLTTLVVRLASGRGLREMSDALLTLCGLVVGAVSAALLAAHAPACVPVLQLALLASVLLGAWRMRERRPAALDTGIGTTPVVK